MPADGHAPGCRAPLGSCVRDCRTDEPLSVTAGRHMRHRPEGDPLVKLVMHLTSALENIAMFAPGKAGVDARDALVEAGVWRDTVDREEQPTALEWWLSHGAVMPCHDEPGDLRWALVLGTHHLYVP